MVFRKSCRLAFCLLIAISASVAAYAEDDKEEKIEKAEKAERDHGMHFAGVPALGYTPDIGFGFGIVGIMYRERPDLHPYQYALDVQLLATTKGMHSHYIKFDYVDAFHIPLRIRAKVGLYAVQNENFCGFGSASNCNEEVPIQMASKLKLNPANAAIFEWEYYKFRYFDIYGILQGRWAFRPFPHKMELLAGWRGSYYLPGQWGQVGPYPGALYTKSFAPSLQQGFASVAELGLSFDNRDEEINPRSGYWVEPMFRFSTPAIGSSWSFVGFQLMSRLYLPLDDKKDWVLAIQGMADVMLGEAPLQEVVKLWDSFQYTVFGGQDVGRGMREQLIPGKIKLVEQLELRYNFVDFTLWKQRLGFVAVAFSDLGYIAWDTSQFFKVPLRLALTFGAGMRVVWNRTFVIRFDLGFSPEEQLSPMPYVTVGNVF